MGTGETVNIDIVKQETGDDDFVDSDVEVETPYLTRRNPKDNYL